MNESSMSESPNPLPLSYRILQQHGKRRDRSFAESAFTYSIYLWERKQYARALLALTRGLYAQTNDPSLNRGYLLFADFLNQYPGDAFMGNPRISYYHQATRMKANHPKINQTRAWALYHLVRKLMPALTPDPKEIETPHPVDSVRKDLKAQGRPQEAEVWYQLLKD